MENEWKETADRLHKGEELNGTDWWVLRVLVNTRFLFGEKKKLKAKLLKELYSCNNYNDEEIQFTKRCIESKFIVQLFRGKDDNIENVKLIRRWLLNYI